MSPKPERPIIIVRRRRHAEHKPHSGAWKVAYADFVTAMMAFFMVMWLIASVTKEQRAAIFQYFKNPSMEDGRSVKTAPGQMGPGGASTSPIDMQGALDARRTVSPLSSGLGTPHDNPELHENPQSGDEHAAAADAAALSEEQARRITEAADHQRLESLMAQLREAIDHSQALKPFKDQLLLDITPEGLRIQIVDAKNRPMFDLGSAQLKSYTAAILHELAPYLNSVPNHISLSGHTDTTPYTARAGYSNWDLSSDRANAARRALEDGGLQPDKVARVVGLSSSVLFDKVNSRDPINRRISIIVMTPEAEAAALKTDNQPEEAPGAAAPSQGGRAAGEPSASPAPSAAAPSAAAAPPASGPDPPP